MFDSFFFLFIFICILFTIDIDNFIQNKENGKVRRNNYII